MLTLLIHRLLLLSLLGGVWFDDVLLSITFFCNHLADEERAGCLGDNYIQNFHRGGGIWSELRSKIKFYGDAEAEP